MNLVTRLQAQARLRPDAPALLHGPRAVTFAELEAATARGAGQLRALGLGPGDAVLCFVPMGIPLYGLLLSVLRLGATAAFLDPGATADQVAAACARLRPRLFAGTPRAQLLPWIRPALRRIPRLVVDGWWFRHPRWGRGTFEAEPIRPCEADHPALLTFTSGSTGVPKIAVRTHGFLLTQHEVLAHTLAHRPGAVDLATLPIFVLANLASGQTSLIPDLDLRRPGAADGAAVLAEARRHRPASLAASPAFLERLVEAAERGTAGLEGFEALYTGGAPVFPGLLRRAQAAAPSARVVAVYGSTEAEPMAEVAFAEMTDRDLEAMGRGRGLLAGRPAAPFVTLRVIRDRWGAPMGSLVPADFEALRLPPGEAGEIVVTGPHVLKGYLDGHGDEETKFRVGAEVWHRTGDAGYLDEAGRLWLLGRCGARIRDDEGELFPFAVECAALQWPGVRRAALASHRGERVLAFEGTAEEAEVQAGLAWARLARALRVPVLPVDRRHNAKVDYPGLTLLLEKHLP